MGPVKQCEKCGNTADGGHENGCPNIGRKDDSGKERYDLIPVDALDEIAKVLTYGAKKYGANNWRKVPGPFERYFAAAQRHMAAWRRGEVRDKESGRAHLAHAICCLVFMMELDQKEPPRPCDSSSMVEVDEEWCPVRNLSWLPCLLIRGHSQEHQFK
jgi:Domain of unknown function (DUF5664)